MHSIAFKRERFGPVPSIETVIPQMVERQARNIVVRGLNPGPDSNFSLEILKNLILKLQLGFFPNLLFYIENEPPNFWESMTPEMPILYNSKS